MKHGEPERPDGQGPGSRTTPSALASIAAPAPVPVPGIVLPCLFVVLLLLCPRPWMSAAWAKDEFPSGANITEVRIQGNVTISTEQIRSKILSRPGSTLDQTRINTDLESLMQTHWFSDVRPYYGADPNGNGYILTFMVEERPVITSVVIKGRTKISLKDIEEATSLKKGNRADAARIRLAPGHIQRLYAEKGYEDAEVQLVKGGNPGETDVIISIFEGEKHKVGGVTFEGNAFATDGVLRTKITSKVKILGIGGSYHRDNLDEDRRKLVEYYQGQGFYDVKVTPVTETGASLGDIRIRYVISEGIRYKVRNISFEGNQKIPTEKLKDGLLMHSGQPILDTLKEADRKTLLAKYYEIGCIDTQIVPDPRLTDQPGVVDVLYRIEEGDPYVLGLLIIKGNERTRDKVLRREAAAAGLLPGQRLNPNLIEKYQQRLSSLSYFSNAPDQGKQIEIKIVNRRPADKPYGDVFGLDPGDVSLTRMQGPEPVVLPGAPTGAGGGSRSGPGKRDGE